MVAGLFPRCRRPCLRVAAAVSAGWDFPQVNCVAQLSDGLGSCPPSDNFPGVNDTDATTLTTWFPSSLRVTRTPETMHCSCSAHAEMSLSPWGATGGAQEQPAVTFPHAGGVIPPHAVRSSLGTWSLPGQPSTASMTLWHTCHLDCSQRKGTRATLSSTTTRQSSLPHRTTWRQRKDLLLITQTCVLGS